MITNESQKLRDQIRSGNINSCGRSGCECERCKEWRWAVAHIYEIERESQERQND